MDTSLKQLYSLYRQHQYPQVVAKADLHPASSPDYYPIQLLRLRALQASGLLQQAYRLAEQWTAHGIADEKWAVCFDLWHRFLLIYHRQLTDLQPTLAYFEQVRQQEEADDYTIGLAYDLAGRVRSLGITVQVFSAVTHKAQVEACWLQAADYYLAAQAQDEYLGVLQLLAQFQQQPPLANRQRARASYEQLAAVETTGNFPFTQLEAGLALAEDDFITLQNSPQAQTNAPTEYERIESVFRAAETVFQTAAYAWGYAWVPEKQGSLLLRYGHAQGEALLHKAAQRYQAGGFAADQQRVLRLLASWYETRGEEARFKQAERAANSLNSQLEFSISQQVAQLNIAHLASREGNYGEVQRLCDKALRDPATTWNRPQFMLLRTIALGTLGRKDKLDAAAQLVRLLEPHGATSTLADALQQQADFLFEHPDQQRQALAAQAMQRAIQLDEQLGDAHAQAGRFIVFGEFLLKGQLAFQQPPVLTAAIEACWASAQALLAGDATYAGALRRCSLKQAIGQQLFQTRKYEAARQLFAEAEQEMRRLGAKGRLLFLYLYQGNLEIQTARAVRDAQHYGAALRLFDQAEALAASTELADMQWRVAFNQGICFREMGQRALAPTQQHAWWEKAEAAYTAAHHRLFGLMLTADYQAGEAEHASRAGFLGERQSIYNQAFFLNTLERRNLPQALQWLDRMKGQALMATILGKGHVPASHVLQPIRFDIDWEQLGQRLSLQEKAMQKRIHVFAYYFTKDYQAVFHLTAGQVAPQVETLAIPFAELQQLKGIVFQTQGGVRRMARDGSDENWFCFSSLIRPIKERTAPGDVVVLIPHGLLHDLPLHTLRTSDQSPLIERNPISYHLSLALLTESLAYTFTKDSTRGEVFGDSHSNLVASGQEAEYVAQRLGVQARIGPLATRPHFLHAFAHADFLHFAGHGKFSRQEGMDQYIALAMGEQVTARELIGLVSTAYLLVLSGCETGVSEYRSGDELFGLVRAVLSAGVATVMASQWPINDPATQQFFASFYERPFTGQAGEKTVALQRAAVHLIRQGYSLYEWGSFTLTGAL